MEHFDLSALGITFVLEEKGLTPSTWGCSSELLYIPALLMNRTCFAPFALAQSATGLSHNSKDQLERKSLTKNMKK